MQIPATTKRYATFRVTYNKKEINQINEIIEMKENKSSVRYVFQTVYTKQRILVIPDKKLRHQSI